MDDEAAQLPSELSLGPAPWLGHTLNRIEYCLEEAERALAAGAPQKARFWAERAQHYRERRVRE